MGYLKLRAEALRLDKAVDDSMEVASRLGQIPNSWEKGYIDSLILSRDEAWRECYLSMDAVNQE